MLGLGDRLIGGWDGVSKRRTNSARFALLAVLVGLGTFTGCGGTTPTTPSGNTIGNLPVGGSTPGFTPSLSASSLERGSSIAPWVNFVERPITFSWDQVPGAAWYVVAVGTSPGAADVFSGSTASLSLTTKFTSAGQFYPQVIAHDGKTTGRASASRIPLILFSFQDYIEALFLGTGSLAQTPQSGWLAGTGRMAGWPAGAQVTVTLAASLNAEQKRRATAAVSQAAEATAGVFDATTRGSSEPYPIQGLSEIVVQQADPSVPFPCSAAALGCALPLQFVSPGMLSRAIVLMRGESILLGHETGHALYGFCHLTVEAGYVSVMGNFDDAGRGPAEADLAATQAVYRAGLRGGSTRGDFVAAGLIKP